MEKYAKPTVISFSVSLFSLVLFILTFFQFGFLIPWIITSVLSAILPFYSKYRRKKSGTEGKWLEVTAFVIGMIGLYLILSLGVGLSTLLVEVLILVICILYMRLFNNILPDM